MRDDETAVFAPFGLGVLDLALVHLVHQQLTAAGGIRQVDSFFSELNRLEGSR